MKRFLKYDTEIVKKENSPVDKNGLIKENIVGWGSSVQSDWNQNDETAANYVKNRPFYTEKEIVVDVSWDGDKTNKVSAADTYYKVSDLMPTADEFIVYLKTGETETSETLTGSDINAVTGFLLIADYAIICYDASQLLMGKISFPETGIYFAHLGDKYVSRLVSETEIVRTIDPKYIVHINELIMNSSTSDSTKKFRITVDDSGTITATEVS